MVDDFIERLKVIDPAILTEVVRLEQGGQAQPLLDWTVSPLNHE